MKNGPHMFKVITRMEAAEAFWIGSSPTNYLRKLTY